MTGSRGPFLWGVATSAYQLEGAAENDWTAWEAAGRLRSGARRCGSATGHRERWSDDLRLLPTIGANAYRLSLEWSRLEPRPGRFDDAAWERERRLVALLTRLGIEPVVTLHHFTHPSWFWEDGGWESESAVSHFSRFTRQAADVLGGQVRWWVTFNEPIVLLLGGYVGGLMPPGRTSFSAAARALQNLLRAHVEAARILRERGAGARIGIAHNMLDFAPDRPGHALDRRFTEAGERLYNLALLEAVATGRMEWSLPGQGKASFAIPDLPAAFDYAGVNYYSRVHLRFRGLGAIPGEFHYRDRTGRGLTDTGWEIHPEGFDRVLRLAAATGRPVLVTENGIATRDDRRRDDFLREHAAVLAHRLAGGTPIAGYFYWSLLDNFEWLEGFRPRFGLFEVDYGTLARRRRRSADLFARIGRGFTGAGAEAAGSAGASRT